MIRRVAAAIVILALAASWPLLAPRQATVAAVDYPCDPGYVQIEDQAWWQDATGEAWPGRHAHQQLCWPTGVVGGVLELTGRVLLHKQPPGAELTRIRATDGGGATLWSQTSFPGATFDAGGNLVVPFTARIDTSKLSRGLHEIRLATIVDQPSGAQQFVSSGHPLYVGAAPAPGTSRDRHEARGWYPLFEYVNARLNPKPGQTANQALADLRIVTPGETFLTECAAPSGEDPTACTVWADPDAHNGHPGTPILGDARGPARREAKIPNLAPGLHKIAIRSEATANLDPISNGTNSGLLVITVLVEGPVPTPTLTSSPTPSPTPTPVPTPDPTPTSTPTATPPICVIP